MAYIRTQCVYGVFMCQSCIIVLRHMILDHLVYGVSDFDLSKMVHKDGPKVKYFRYDIKPTKMDEWPRGFTTPSNN